MAEIIRVAAGSGQESAGPAGTGPSAGRPGDNAGAAVAAALGEVRLEALQEARGWPPQPATGAILASAPAEGMPWGGHTGGCDGWTAGHLVTESIDTGFPGSAGSGEHAAAGAAPGAGRNTRPSRREPPAGCTPQVPS
jgi:hypothetical protein